MATVSLKFESISVYVMQVESFRKGVKQEVD